MPRKSLPVLGCKNTFGWLSFVMDVCLSHLESAAMLEIEGRYFHLSHHSQLVDPTKKGGFFKTRSIVGDFGSGEKPPKNLFVGRH